MNPIVLTTLILIVVLGFSALVGLIKSLVRLISAILVGVAMPALLYYAADWLGLAQSVPDGVYILVGALSALSMLLRRRRR